MEKIDKKLILPKVSGPATLASQVTTSAAKIGTPEYNCPTGPCICYLPIIVIYFPLFISPDETFINKIAVILSSSNNTLVFLEEDDLFLTYSSMDHKVKPVILRDTTQRLWTSKLNAVNFYHF